MILISITFHIFFILCVYYDIKKRIIPEFYFRIMLILSLIKCLINSNIIDTYHAISIFIFPVFLQIFIETYTEKEIIGLGDVKLFMVIALYFSNINISFVYNFYTTLYLLSAIYILLFRKFKGYIAFAPLIYITFFIYEWRLYEK